ncbi:MAG: MBL fold metallo-hydrolase [Clostridia bacterium]|nr:MBL fold metallo-hydrolase [Clostridia bacterium]
MLNFCSLYSGSSGNSLFVETENTKVLIDAGMSCKKIEEALGSIDVEASSINAILVTHEHIDHIRGISTISKKFDIPVFATKETFDAMPKQTEKISNYNINFFVPSEKFCINDLEVLPFSIPHDAANPCGFNIKNDTHQISVATDIGHMNRTILNHLEGSEFVLLESNYETEVLKCCTYPFKLKSRIASNIGHLSNEMAGKTISYLLKNSNLKTALLGHLSKESNFPELAYQTVVDELISESCNLDSINLSVASRDNPSKLIKL